MRWRAVIVAVVGIAGCTDDVPEQVECTEQLDGVCVGVENEAGDQAGACPCSAPSVRVASHDALMTALAGEPTCIMLEDGAYGVVELRDGFELVGASVDGVQLQWLSFLDGSASGCRLKATGSFVAEGASATLQYLRIGPSPVDGVLVSPGAEARIVGSTIEQSTRYGVSAFGIRSLTIERSVIAGASADAGGPGVYASCPEGCACAVRPEIDIHDTVVRETRVVGVAITGAHAELRNMRIANTFVGANFDGGLGLGIGDCATVTASGVEIVDNADGGVCIDGSKVEFANVAVTGNLRGIFMGSGRAPSEVRITGATISSNLGVGLGITGATFATVEDSIVEDTQSQALIVGMAPPPNLDGFDSLEDEPRAPMIQEVADGICWNGSAVVHVRRVTIRGNQRQGMLIQGPASGVLDDVAVVDGQIMQVNYESGAQPMISGATWPILTSASDSSRCMDEYY